MGLELLAVPAIPLTMTSGVIFGVVPGTVVVSVASVAAATLAFLIARYAARDRVCSLMPCSPQLWQDYGPQDQLWCVQPACSLPWVHLKDGYQGPPCAAGCWCQQGCLTSGVCSRNISACRGETQSAGGSARCKQAVRLQTQLMRQPTARLSSRPLRRPND